MRNLFYQNNYWRLQIFNHCNICFQPSFSSLFGFTLNPAKSVTSGLKCLSRATYWINGNFFLHPTSSHLPNAGAICTTPYLFRIQNPRSKLPTSRKPRFDLGILCRTSVTTIIIKQWFILNHQFITSKFFIISNFCSFKTSANLFFAKIKFSFSTFSLT